MILFSVSPLLHFNVQYTVVYTVIVTICFQTKNMFLAEGAQEMSSIWSEQDRPMNIIGEKKTKKQMRGFHWLCAAVRTEAKFFIVPDWGDKVDSDIL
jgi:hypothetical protein